MGANDSRHDGHGRAEAVDDVVARVQSMHKDISELVFRGIGPRSKPVKRVYDIITDNVYGTIHSVLSPGGEHVPERVPETAAARRTGR